MRRIVRFMVILTVLLAVVLGAATGLAIYTTRRMLPQLNGSLTLAGLDGSVTVYRDSIGVPHIYASTARDLFFAQGVVHAQDRWWQMEFSRHTGLGRISELTGNNESARENDIFIRTVGWNRSAQRDLDVMGDASRAALDAYTSGVNAYLEGRSGPDLAIEYSLLALRGVNIPIEAWQPLHSVAWGKVMAWSLSGNLSTELQAANLVRERGETEAAEILSFLNAPYPYEAHPSIVTADDLPIGADPVLGSVENRPDDGFFFRPARPGTRPGSIHADLIGTPPDFGGDTGLGSNSWVVSGSLTDTGRSLLANDPHLGIQMPSIWHQAGLHCTEISIECPYDVVGYSFPGVPGVLVGHNQHIAWGITNGTVDTQDLYIITQDPDDDARYQVDGEWHDMEIITETIRFGDNTPPLDIRVRETRFGPIITDTPSYAEDGPTPENPLALRWSAISEQTDLLGAILDINRATDWESFRTGLTGWRWPTQNFVYADSAGNIGYQLAGLLPIRAAEHGGARPDDGSTTASDWKGFIPFDYLPRLLNPERGYIVAANNAVVPEDYYGQLAEAIGEQFGADSNYHLSTRWDYGYRAARAVELIAAQDGHTVDSMWTIMTDNHNLAIEQVLPVVLDLDFENRVPGEVITWMQSWDSVENVDSGQAALAAALWAEIATRLWTDDVGAPQGASGASWAVNLLMDDPDHFLWDDRATEDVRESRDEILRESFVAAYESLVSRLGADFNTWRWGAVHTGTFVSNPLGASGIDLVESYVNGGPVALGGGNETLNRAAWNVSEPFETQSIASLRMVVDVGGWENSRWVNTTGQSGHPMSVHYRDQIDPWRLFEAFPMRAERPAIERAALNTLTLQPR